MVDTRKLKDYIKLSDLDPGDVLEFVTEGEIVDRDFAKQGEDPDIKSCLEMMVSLNGDEAKKLTINQTTINILNEKWTHITAKWVGKKAEAEKRKILSFGKWIEIIVLEPIESVDPPSPEPEPQAAPPSEAEAPKEVKPEENFCECGNECEKELNAERNVDVCKKCGKDVVAWDGEG